MISSQNHDVVRGKRCLYNNTQALDTLSNILLVIPIYFVVKGYVGRAYVHQNDIQHDYCGDIQQLCENTGLDCSSCFNNNPYLSHYRAIHCTFASIRISRFSVTVVQVVCCTNSCK